MYPYRVFVSYSREDHEIARRIVSHLETIELRPMWDANLTWGRFAEQIKDGISFAHAFLPLLTESSTKRPWVHQEIGYAVALNVPVLPLAIGQLPLGMIQGLHALGLNPDLHDLEKQLSAAEMERVIGPAQKGSFATFDCAELPEDRATMLAGYANRVIALGEHGRVRQRGALSSFCLPDKPLTHPIWDEREGDTKRSDYYRKLQRAERRSLEQHARESGCDLIINPHLTLKHSGPRGRKARLQTLAEFLEGMPDEKVRVAVSRNIRGNLLIVGDWFAAESLSARPGVGYFQTVCTRHAPTVLDRIERFDEEFEYLLKTSDLGNASSRLGAIEVIGEVLDSIKE